MFRYSPCNPCCQNSAPGPLASVSLGIIQPCFDGNILDNVYPTIPYLITSIVGPDGKQYLTGTTSIQGGTAAVPVRQTTFAAPPGDYQVTVEVDPNRCDFSGEGPTVTTITVGSVGTKLDPKTGQFPGKYQSIGLPGPPVDYCANFGIAYSSGGGGYVTAASIQVTGGTSGSAALDPQSSSGCYTTEANQGSQRVCYFPLQMGAACRISADITRPITVTMTLNYTTPLTYYYGYEVDCASGLGPYDIKTGKCYVYNDPNHQDFLFTRGGDTTTITITGTYSYCSGFVQTSASDSAYVTDQNGNRVQVWFGGGGSSAGCACFGTPDPYSSNTDKSPQVLPAMAPFRGTALAPSPRLRLGLVCPWLLQGGAENWQLTLADGLTGLLGDLVSFEGAACINRPAEPAMLADLSARMPVAFGWGAARDLAARCDVVVTWHVADYAALFDGIPSPPKVLFACHLPTRWGAGTEALLSTVDRLVAVSPSAFEPIPPSLLPRSVVVANAVDEGRLRTSRTRDEVRAAWGVPADAPTVAFLGRLSPEKDPDAAVRLAEEWPEGHVVVVGDGPLRTALGLGAPPNLHVVGPDADKGVLLACDALMVPSLYESFGLAPAEAMRMGVPVLATGTGIVAEHPALARVVPIGAGGGEWADAVRADRADAEGTARRVAAARDFVVENYSLDRFARAYASVLADLAPPAVGERIRHLLLPSLGTMAGNFARSAFHQMAAGNPEASAEVRGARLRACEACPMLDHAIDRCRECGCTQMALKRRWATSRCPLGKWEQGG